jgi:hypothetical protein
MKWDAVHLAKPADRVAAAGDYIDTLVKCGALRERADGWYSRGILTTRSPR